MKKHSEVFTKYRKIIARASTKEDIIEILNFIRPIASYTKSIPMQNMIKSIYDKDKYLIDNEINCFLLDLEIRQLYHSLENMSKIEVLIQKMQYLIENSKNNNLQALFYQIVWYIEKLKGNKKKSSIVLNKIKYLVENDKIDDLYSLNYCKYSLAYELWIEKHDVKCSVIFEECLEYFYKNGFVRSVIQILCILNIIYQREHNSKKILERSKRIIMNQDFFNDLTNELKAILYYSIGLGHMIDLNLNFAESFFKDAYNILKPIHKKSIYFSNFINLHSFLCTVISLQGKLEQSLQLIEDVENLLNQEFFEKNLDLNTKKQILHTLNLNKFYVYSRRRNFDTEEMQNLIKEIYFGCKNLYSDFMLVSEFILNSNLECIKMEELMRLDNFSINRVKHIIQYTLQKSNIKEELNDCKHLQRVEILKNRDRTKKTNFIENVFADLLIAQQLFSLKRYEEIYSLLRKYETQLHRIEVLELRIFMEAFIQVGKFKSGDPLGPALQYMAIKKCRQYGFSGLEKKLLDYLDMQYKEIQSFNI